jgi:hypothetical protein
MSERVPNIHTMGQTHELAVDITTDSYRTSHRLNVGLLHQNFPGLHNKVVRILFPVSAQPKRSGALRGVDKTDLVAESFDICLCELLALAELFDPAIDFVFHKRSESKDNRENEQVKLTVSDERYNCEQSCSTRLTNAINVTHQSQKIISRP